MWHWVISLVSLMGCWIIFYNDPVLVLHVLSCHVLSYPVMSCLIMWYPVLFRPAISCPMLNCCFIMPHFCIFPDFLALILFKLLYKPLSFPLSSPGPFRLIPSLSFFFQLTPEQPNLLKREDQSLQLKRSPWVSAFIISILNYSPPSSLLSSLPSYPSLSHSVCPSVRPFHSL